MDIWGKCPMLMGTKASQHDGMTTTPEAAAAATKHADLPSGDDERVVGFGVMGLPFASGHYLAFRDFPATSFSPAYLSVWHRNPEGVWTFYATRRARRAVRGTSARRHPSTRWCARSNPPGSPRGRC